MQAGRKNMFNRSFWIYQYGSVVFMGMMVCFCLSAYFAKSPSVNFELVLISILLLIAAILNGIMIRLSELLFETRRKERENE